MDVGLRRKWLVYCFAIYTAIIFFLYIIIGNSFLKYLEFINCSFSLILFVISFHLLGFRPNKQNRLKLNILYVTLIVVLMYFILTYGLGLFVGFLKNSFALSFLDIFNNSIFIFLTILFSEMFRYIFISSNDDNKNFIIISLVLCSFEFINCFNIYNYTSVFELLRFLSLCLLPMVFKHFTLSYLCKYSGYLPCIIYRILIECYIYCVPIFPNLGDFVDSVFLVILPFYIYSAVSRIVSEHINGIEYSFSDKAFNVFDIPVIGTLVLFVVLISGVAPIYMVGIASASMEPDIFIGDAVILKKVSKDDSFRVGDIIAFQKDGKTVVHRVVEVLEDNGTFYYNTKGDNNNSPDGIYLDVDDIEGVFLLKIPYIANVSIWINNLVGG